MTEEKKPMDWEAVAAAKAKALGLPAEGLKQEVRRALTARVAQGIVEELLKSAPFDWRAAGMTSEVSW